MDTRVDAERLHRMLDNAEKELADVGQEMRVLLAVIEQKIFPKKEMLEALEGSLRNLAAGRAALVAKSAAFGEDLSAECAIADWRRALSDYEERCANAAGQEALALLRRMYSEDEMCQAALEEFRARFSVWDADVLRKENPDLFRGVKVLVDAFREKKPMTPPRKITGYTKELHDFPDILISAATVDDPPLRLHEQEAAREVAVHDAAAEDIAPKESLESEKEADELRVATMLFDRIGEKCARECGFVEIKDVSAEKKPTSKTIKHYLSQGTAVIRYLRCVAMLTGTEKTFTAQSLTACMKTERHLAEAVLSDMVQRGFLCSFAFRGLPLLYAVPISLYGELNTKDVLRLLHHKSKLVLLPKDFTPSLPLQALQQVLYEKAHLHARRGGALQSGHISEYNGEGFFCLTACRAGVEKQYVFVGTAPLVKWLEKVRSALGQSPKSALYLLGVDESHVEETRRFLEDQWEAPLKITDIYVWEGDTWKEAARGAAEVRLQGAGDAAATSADVPEAERAASDPLTTESAAENSLLSEETGAAPDEAADASLVSMSGDEVALLDGIEASMVSDAASPVVPDEAPSPVAAPADEPTEESLTDARLTHMQADPPLQPSAAGAPSRMTTDGICSGFMDDADIEKNFHAMLEYGDFASASAYLHAAAHFAPGSWKQLNQELAYALFAPLQKCRYSSDILMNIYFTQSEGEPHEGLAVSAMLWNFYLDHTPYDYGMQSLLDTAKGFDLLKDAAGLSDALYTLMKFKKDAKSGADKYADYRLKDKSHMEENLRELQAKAGEYENSFIHGHITETGSNRRFIETQKLLFDAKGDLANALHFVATGDGDAFELVRDYVAETFMEDAAEGAVKVDEQNISMDKINHMIDDCWHRAGNLILLRKVTSKLVGSYRSSLQKRIEKISLLLTQWVKCSEALDLDEANSSLPAYRKMHGRLIEQLDKAQESVHATALPAWERQVLSHTLGEILRRLRGDYDEKEQRYFYASFLQTPYVLLNEDFLPRVTQPVGDLEAFFPLRRIEQHFKAEKHSFLSRLQEIFDGNDDLGSARLIVSYLDAMGETLPPEMRSMFDRMDADRIVAHAERVKKEFIESLELAQSYGQIESAAEDKKEKILNTTEAWFERCRKNLDYGFFAAIIEAFKKKIDSDAERRGRLLAAELNKLRTNRSALPDDEEKERCEAKIEKIRRMIDSKNYTVAEDMLHRFGDDADDSPLESLQTDELEDFLHAYDISYNKVYDLSRALSYLVSLHGYNKETRGGEALLGAWPSSKGSNQSAMIKQLLYGLGFAVSSVTARPPIGKTENYEVFLTESAGGRRNYAHPFAVFGSKAAKSPFRVICLYGKFDADALIDRFKEIGTSKPTIVLLDCALRKDQRNRLARKTKLEIPECCFAVIDRVAIVYLAEHYVETKINRMMLSITMPYTFYQPYIPNAANAMPPEMFMGRKEALDKIVNPLGENIVYGGRQLGKSALLRMAEYTVERLGDGSRALMVDIKGFGVEEAALRISHEFADRGILAKNFETRDWGELARAIRLRLAEEEQKIPYLLLLIDEADAFIESCKMIDYRPFEELKNIQTIGQERFKFVIAGLRNVVRFDKEALSNNSVLAHLKSYTVRPFSVTEARELLEVPLACLGLRFSKEKQALVSTILATTNYFPGLIQLYCYKLLEAMKKDYAGYEEANTPPYEINEKHIKKVLAEADFTQDIYNKFDITLRVDEDCYYHILAILMADLYHEGANPEGYLPEDILECGREYGIKKMENLSPENVHALMEELRELNIFRLTAGGRYLFARYNFFQLMGSKEHLEKELLTYMEV